jgi:hypothetical protein
VPPEGQSQKDVGETVGVRIPKATAERVSKRLSDSGFRTVDEYVGYVVDMVLNEVEGGPKTSDAPSPESFTKEDQEAVEQKLKELGYL